ncbi:helix-turn-helix domain-containing protein [Paenibacillus hodogayensis]|uniref:Helix-turn-helix domain-containing protein n=1 Tax=Paenibacillus hodogayensis TaxID=279208 RepID=A0ABV5W7W8_9BACL
MVDSRKVGVIIYERRSQKAWTQEQLGISLGVSAQAVSKWEKGDSLPDVAILPQLARLLECTVDYLLGSRSTLHHLLPQIDAQLSRLKEEEKIDFIGQIIHAIRPPQARRLPDSTKPNTTFLMIGNRSVMWWVKQKSVFIATEDYLRQSKAALATDIDFPLNLIPPDPMKVLAALIPDQLANPPDYVISESTIRAGLSDDFDFHATMDACIELGFAERIRGGYRLNLKGSFAMRVLSILNAVLNERAGTSVAYPPQGEEKDARTPIKEEKER